MSFIELLIIAIGVSMDAFAVAVCKGLSMTTVNKKNALKIGLYFGFFQALMPLIGYSLGIGFHEKIAAIDHWIAFVLLGLIGLNMVKESLELKNQCEIDQADPAEDGLCPKNLCILSIATSIDALAVGITLAFLNVNIVSSASIIGITTFLISTIGVYIGSNFGAKFKSKAEFFGGSVLILMGIKILLSHLGLIGF